MTLIMLSSALPLRPRGALLLRRMASLSSLGTKTTSQHGLSRRWSGTLACARKENNNNKNNNNSDNTTRSALLTTSSPHGRRSLSTNTKPNTTTASTPAEKDNLHVPLDLSSHPYAPLLNVFTKLKPHIANRRIRKLRTVEGRQRDIRHSPWRLNLVCKLVAGMPLLDALQQLEFCPKRAAPWVRRVLHRTANLADIRHQLQPSQLQVAECFATHGKHLKRMKIMGRGRTGVMHHRFSHLRVVLREIDFPLEIVRARTRGQKLHWLRRHVLAERDAQEARQKTLELQELERQHEEQQKKKKSSS